MVLESQSLWKMELVKQGNEKLLKSLGRRSVKESLGGLVGTATGQGWESQPVPTGRWQFSHSPRLPAGCGAAVDQMSVYPQNLIPNVMVLEVGPLGGERSCGWSPVNGVSALIQEAPQTSPRPFRPVRTQQGGGAGSSHQTPNWPVPWS